MTNKKKSAKKFRSTTHWFSWEISIKDGERKNGAEETNGNGLRLGNLATEMHMYLLSTKYKPKMTWLMTDRTGQGNGKTHSNYTGTKAGWEKQATRKLKELKNQNDNSKESAIQRSSQKTIT